MTDRPAELVKPADCTCGFPEVEATWTGHATDCPVHAQIEAQVEEMGKSRPKLEHPRYVFWLAVYQDLMVTFDCGIRTNTQAHEALLNWGGEWTDTSVVHELSAPWPWHLAPDAVAGVHLYSPAGQIRLTAEQVYEAARSGQHGFRFEGEGPREAPG